MEQQKSPAPTGLQNKPVSRILPRLPKHWWLAMSLVNHGIKLLPCFLGRPLTLNEITGASSDVNLITTWGALMYPWADVAIATGSASGVVAVVVDLDNDGHVMWEHLLDQYGDFPATWHCRVDNKFLYLLKSDDSFASTELFANDLHGISIKAEDDFAVLFPRARTSEVHFYFCSGDFQISPIPDWLKRYYREGGVNNEP